MRRTRVRQQLDDSATDDSAMVDRFATSAVTERFVASATTDRFVTSAVTDRFVASAVTERFVASAVTDRFVTSGMIDRFATSWYGRRALPHQRDLPSGARKLVGAAILTLAAALGVSGCGPIEYINQVGVKAAGAVSAAKLAQADRYAPYEYTAAEEYLHKAREEAAYAEYEEAIEFGRRAEELANKGRAIAVTKLSQSAASSSSSPSGATPVSEAREPAPRPRSEDETPR